MGNDAFLLSARDLAERFNVPLDTAKRWSREFLPPDPTAGRGAGIARMFSADECVILFLAAYLLRNEGYGTVDTQQILEDLTPWLLAKRLLPSRTGPKGLKGQFWELFIQKKKEEAFFRYDAKHILEKEVLKKGSKTITLEQYVLEPVTGKRPLNGMEFTRLIRLSMLILHGMGTIGWKIKGSGATT